MHSSGALTFTARRSHLARAIELEGTQAIQFGVRAEVRAALNDVTGAIQEAEARVRLASAQPSAETARELPADLESRQR